jgi:hypothetical protein
MYVQKSSLILVTIIAILFGVISLVQRTTASAQNAAASQRQVWEYTCVVISRAAQTDAKYSSWGIATPDGKYTELSGPVSMPTKIPELGAQGWELFDITPVSDTVGDAINDRSVAGFTNQLMYWFKRAK